jgi:hypothetical protein
LPSRSLAKAGFQQSTSPSSRRVNREWGNHSHQPDACHEKSAEIAPKGSGQNYRHRAVEYDLALFLQRCADFREGMGNDFIFRGCPKTQAGNTENDFTPYQTLPHENTHWPRPQIRSD